MNKVLSIGSVFSWAFGMLVIAVGVLNTFWGNDPGYGIFLLLLSFVYFPTVNNFILHKVGFPIPLLVKLFLGILIIVSALGVGELFDKIDLMIMSLS